MLICDIKCKIPWCNLNMRYLKKTTLTINIARTYHDHPRHVIWLHQCHLGGRASPALDVSALVYRWEKEYMYKGTKRETQERKNSSVSCECGGYTRYFFWRKIPCIPSTFILEVMLFPTEYKPQTLMILLVVITEARCSSGWQPKDTQFGT